ncbi:hypothetical protein P2318_18120 [Myxococcaceae bacterium GXIMD 01537]
MSGAFRRGLLAVGGLLLLGGCHEDTTATPRLTVEVFDVEGDCFAPCANRSEKAAEVRLGDECATASASRVCDFEGGKDRLRLTVDYGSVEFDKPADVPAPTLTVRVNETALTSPPGFTVHPRDGRHVFFTTSLIAPPQAAQSFGFAVGAGDFATTLDGFRISEPKLSVAVGACMGCPVVAGTSVPVTVTAPWGLQPRAGSLLLKLAGQEYGTPVPLELSAVRGTQLVQTVSVAVPDKPEAKWTLEARVGPAVGSGEVTVARPALALQVLECPDAAGECTLPAGTMATVQLAAPRELAAASVTLTSLTDGLAGEPQAFALNRTEGNMVSGLKPIAVPDAPGSRWRLIARLGATSLEREIALVAPAITVRAGNCPVGVEPCTVSAGVGSVLVTVSAPARLVADAASLTWTLDDVPAGTNPVSVPFQWLNDGKFGAVSIPAPDRPGSTLRFAATVGRTRALSAPLQLSQPRTIRLRLVPKGTPRDAIDFGVPGVPARASGEPDANCRELLLAVDAPEVTQGRVTLQSTLGTMDGRGTQVEVALDGNRRAYVPLLLPAEHTSTRMLQISASASSQRSDPLSLPLKQVYPVAGNLFAPSTQVLVGASGSAAATLKGQFVLPAGAKAVAGTPVWLVVTATPSADPGPLPCGRPVPPEVIACDPTDPGASGGCLLAPLSASVDELGRYSVTLSAGTCFAGDVTIEARSVRYLGDDTACLGERSVTASAQAVGRVTLGFTP